jgi:hypothetical protein
MLTDALSVADPPGPLQVRVNVLLELIFSMVSEPDVSFEPDHPPDALQVSAFADVHSKVADPLQDTDAGAMKSTVGLSDPQSCEQFDLVSPQLVLHLPSPQV